MELKPDFIFEPLPAIEKPLRFLFPHVDDTLGPISALPGTWEGKGFNVIWRPNSRPGQDRFLELNLTEETLQVERIAGEIPNRGFLQADIKMFGVTYLQQIKDANNKAGLHIEPGIWATVPQTENPAEVPTVVRMGSIPHGTTILLQGIASHIPGPPTIPVTNIIPFVIGNPNGKIPFPESNLSLVTDFRSPPQDIVNITQQMVDNPNSVLLTDLTGQTVKESIALDVSSDATRPVLGGGLANTAFLQGSAAPGGGPNAQSALVNATFWIETVAGKDGGPDLLQLQYTQTVLLNFNGLSWPHITVGTLRKTAPAAARS